MYPLGKWGSAPSVRLHSSYLVSRLTYLPFLNTLCGVSGSNLQVPRDRRTTFPLQHKIRYPIPVNATYNSSGRNYDNTPRTTQKTSKANAPQISFPSNPPLVSYPDLSSKPPPIVIYVYGLPLFPFNPSIPFPTPPPSDQFRLKFPELSGYPRVSRSPAHQFK